MTVVLSSVGSLTAAKPTAEVFADELAAYLRNPNPNLRQSQRASSIARQAQMIELTYKRASPVLSPEDREWHKAIGEKMLWTSWGGPGVNTDIVCTVSFDAVDGQTFPRIHAFYAKLHGDSPPKPIRMIEGMRVPLAHGYTLASINVLPLPTLEARKRSFTELETLVGRLTEALKQLQPQYAQLAEFDGNHSRVERWSMVGEESPGSLPSFDYRYALGPDTKSGAHHDAQDWCDLWLSAWIIRPDWEQRAYTKDDTVGWRNYERQGMRVRFGAFSEDKEFNKEFGRIVDNLLTPLDKIEAELREADERPTP